MLNIWLKSKFLNNTIDPNKKTPFSSMLPIIETPCVKIPQSFLITQNIQMEPYGIGYKGEFDKNETEIRLDFGSPTTKKAAEKMGISYDDCVLKYILK